MVAHTEDESDSARMSSPKKSRSTTIGKFQSVLKVRSLWNFLLPYLSLKQDMVSSILVDFSWGMKTVRVPIDSVVRLVKDYVRMGAYFFHKKGNLKNDVKMRIKYLHLKKGKIKDTFVLQSKPFGNDVRVLKLNWYGNFWGCWYLLLLRRNEMH